MDCYPVVPVPVELCLRPQRLRDHIGAEISDEEQFTILEDLGCTN